MYTLINTIIMFLSILFYYVPLSNNKRRKLFLWIIGIILVFISGFRGDFTVDYGTYKSIFLIVQNTSFKSILLGDVDVEIGYAILNKLVLLFTSNYNVLLLIISAIIVSIYFVKFYQYSPYVWLSTLLLINFGSYYTSFNTLRQFLVATLFILAAEFIYKGKFLKYLFAICLLFFIHKSVVFMIPIYFILRMRWNKLSNLFILTIFSACYVFLFFFIEQFVNLGIDTIYKGYGTDNAYGIETAVPIFALLRPVVIFLIVMFLIRKIDFSNTKELVWFNSIVCLVLISILSLKVEIFQRFTYYFLPFMTFLIPVALSRVQGKAKRYFMIILILIIILTYGLSTNWNNTYSFVWN